MDTNEAIVYGLLPVCSLGAGSWDYNTLGVAHYGLLPDFLNDVLYNYGEAGEAVFTNLMSEAYYFFKTWQICENGGNTPPAPILFHPDTYTQPSLQLTFVTDAVTPPPSGHKMGISISLVLTNGAMKTFSAINGPGFGDVFRYSSFFRCRPAPCSFSVENSSIPHANLPPSRRKI